MNIILALWRLGQEDTEFEFNLGYIMSSGLYSQTMLQKKEKEKKKDNMGGLFCFVDLICFLSQSLEPLPLASRMPRYELNIFIFHHCLWSPEITPVRGSLSVSTPVFWLWPMCLDLDVTKLSCQTVTLIFGPLEVFPFLKHSLN